MDETLLLIRDIKSKPELWNQISNGYHNREITDQIWNELSYKYSTSVEALKAKWIGLRSQFRKLYLRQIKYFKMKSNKKISHSWKYFIPLLFLRNQMKKIKPKSSQTSSDINLDSDEEVVNEMNKELEILEAGYDEPYLEEQTETCDLYSNVIDYDLDNQSSNSIMTSLLQSFQKDITELEKEKIATIDVSKTDEDVLFLHSLLPFMKSLNFHKKLTLRTKIQSLICNYITNLDSDYFDSVKTDSAQSNTPIAADKTNDDQNTEEINVQIIGDVSNVSPMNNLSDGNFSEINKAQPQNEINTENITLFNNENTIDENMALKYLKDDSCVWLLNIGE